MSKLDLSGYSEGEIIEAFFTLKAAKFLAVMNGLSSMSKRIEQQGDKVADSYTDEVVNDMIRQMFTDK